MPMLEARPDGFNNTLYRIPTDRALDTHPDHADHTANHHRSIRSSQAEARAGDDGKVETPFAANVPRTASGYRDQEIAYETCDDSKARVEAKRDGAGGRL